MLHVIERIGKKCTAWSICTPYEYYRPLMQLALAAFECGIPDWHSGYPEEKSKLKTKALLVKHGQLGHGGLADLLQDCMGQSRGLIKYRYHTWGHFLGLWSRAARLGISVDKVDWTKVKLCTFDS